MSRTLLDPRPGRAAARRTARKTTVRSLVPWGLALLAACGAEDGATRGAHAEAGSARPPRAAPTSAPVYDWLLRGGRVVDGSGGPGRITDVLLLGDRIAYVGAIDPDTIEVRDVFDATGLVVAPGFIDLHAHGDPREDPLDNFLAMGVTTIVLGQDGSSPRVGGLEAHLDALRRRPPAVNVGYFVGHNTIRQEAGVGFGSPDADGLARMRALVEQAMEAGALGLSTGLEYSPGRFATLDELVALAEPVAERGGVVSSHVRSEDRDRVEASIEELLEQGRRSGAAVHVSHLKVVLGSGGARAERILERMAATRAEGFRVSGDVYPYLASFTGIALLFPEWALPPADYAAILERRRGELLTHLRDRVEARNGPGATLFGSGPWSGRTLEAAAHETGRPFEEILAELGPHGASAAYFVMDEAVLRTFLADPWVAVASDGSPTMAHPRGYGTFARVIRRYVVEGGLLPLEEAVRKMTLLPASILRLAEPEADRGGAAEAARRARTSSVTGDRGSTPRTEPPLGAVRAGWSADLVAFDPEQFRDLADFENPHRTAEGMRRVWVGGRLAWIEGGRVDGPASGRVILRNAQPLPAAGPGH